VTALEQQPYRRSDACIAQSALPAFLGENALTEESRVDPRGAPGWFAADLRDARGVRRSRKAHDLV